MPDLRKQKQQDLSDIQLGLSRPSKTPVNPSEEQLGLARPPKAGANPRDYLMPMTDAAKRQAAEDKDFEKYSKVRPEQKYAFGGLSKMIRGAISRAAPAAAPAPSTSMPAPSTSMGSKLGQMAAQAIQNPAPAAPVASNIGGRLNGVVNRLRAGFKMKDGGKVPSSKNSSGSSASKRGDGIAQRGKTKGRMV